MYIVVHTERSSLHRVGMLTFVPKFRSSQSVNLLDAMMSVQPETQFKLFERVLMTVHSKKKSIKFTGKKRQLWLPEFYRILGFTVLT